MPKYVKRDGTTITWTGTKACVCTACEVLFAGITAFDARLTRNGKRKAGAATHLAPEEAGLVLNAKGQWAIPVAAEDKQKLMGLRNAMPLQV